MWDIDLSPDRRQTDLYNADGENNKIWVLDRDTDRVIDSFGRNGRSAGQFHWVHNLAVDSHGNIYTAEVDTGKRAQKFVPRAGTATRLNPRSDAKRERRHGALFVAAT